MKEVTRGQYRISQMTLGTAQLGLKYGIANKSGQPDEETAKKILKAAVDNGIQSIDTAYNYGDAEKLLGQFYTQDLHPTYISKMNLTIDLKKPAKEIEREMFGIVEGSMERLRVKKIPVMMLHNPEVLNVHGALITETLQKLQNEGMIGQAGISLRPDTEQLAIIHTFADIDLYEAVQIPFNVLDQRLLQNGALKLLEKRQKTIFARSIFMQGLLLLQEHELPANIMEAESFLVILRRLSEREGVSLTQMALSFVRDIPSIHSLVLGVETVEQLEDCVMLLEGPKLSEETRSELSRLIINVPNKVVNAELWQRK
jgi:aryl-alcohol dehydrogenase-like predicted oxidoreductase